MGTYAFDKENTKKITLKLNVRTDSDLLEQLAKQSNVQGYIKSLIREDVNRNPAPARVDPE